MCRLALPLVAIGLVLSTAGRASEPSSYEDVIASLFRQAIVKVDVSSITPVFKENDKKEIVNVCKSEGTGFLVNSNHVVTAEHVYLLAPECGERNIVIKSKKNNLQKLAQVIAAKDDVGLLKVDSDFPAEMCALGLMKQDVYGTQAIRFGIPGGWDQPGPPVGVKIDEKDGQFSPLTLLAPAIAERGESGGPVIYLFNVVGLTRARHARYLGYSFMTAASAIRTLMVATGVQPSGHICNPVEASMWTNINQSLPSPPPPGFPGALLGGNNSLFKGSVVASVRLDQQLTAHAPGIAPDIFKNIGRTLGASTLNANLSPAGTDVSIQGQFNSKPEYDDVLNQTTRATDDVSSQIREALWKAYVAEAEKAGKWKDAVIPSIPSRMPMYGPPPPMVGMPPPR